MLLAVPLIFAPGLVETAPISYHEAIVSFPNRTNGV